MARILVIDDNEDIRTLLSYLLDEAGHETAMAVDAAEALSRLAEPDARPDLIFLDVNMPGMDGYTLSGRLAEDEALRGIPVVIMTTKGQLRDLFSSSSNVVHFLQKPFSSEDVQTVLGQALRS